MSTTLTHSHSTCRVFGCLKIYKFGVTFGTDNRFTFATVKPATLLVASQELRRQEIKRDIEKLCMCKTKIDKILLSDI